MRGRGRGKAQGLPLYKQPPSDYEREPFLLFLSPQGDLCGEGHLATHLFRPQGQGPRANVSGMQLGLILGISS